MMRMALMKAHVDGDHVMVIQPPRNEAPCAARSIAALMMPTLEIVAGAGRAVAHAMDVWRMPTAFPLERDPCLGSSHALAREHPLA